MTVRTLYICDRCGNEQDKAAQFWTVGVTANCGELRMSTYFVPGKYIQVCRPCLDNMGVLVKEKPKDQESPQPPTVEDLVREIIQLCSE